MSEWICYVTSRFPWPPNSGAERRVFQQLLMLGDHYKVCLVTSSRSLEGVSDEFVEELRGIVDDLVVVPRSSRWVRRGAGLASGWPLQVARAYDGSLHQAIRQAERRHDAVCTLYSLVRTAPYMGGRRTAAVLDFCDALSFQFARRVEHARPGMRAVLRAEAHLLRQYERWCNRSADVTTITTRADADRVGGGATYVIPTTYEISDGVDGADPVEIIDGTVLVFTGDMSTQYSEEAAVWFAHQVLPTVLRQVPTARFFIVGRAPGPRIRQLSRDLDAVTVTGAVESVASYLRAASVAVVPLQFGTGIKNKMLEAFAEGVPVVATTLSDEGMGAASAGGVTLADDPAEFAHAVVRLVQNIEARSAQVAAATAFARERYGRALVTSQLVASVEGARRRAARTQRR
ncbi:glycosyltransferase [Nocardioides aurantiacus]|uniref:Glycosyltransferase involved in cell wall biosynthesis n=1 Tax=Nocardioides aurantiacus TaxID=86796 RepID=A0A3N2CZB5_9ACTN|nr:glycosyltransferase [Nocardioides aurantiacus]ROR92534.1 glycosyltransferase involved in cell wall biosynthesis [Nocardioides aurantiacus]